MSYFNKRVNSVASAGRMRRHASWRLSSTRSIFSNACKFGGSFQRIRLISPLYTRIYFQLTAQYIALALLHVSATECSVLSSSVAPWKWLRFVAETCRNVKTMYFAVSWKWTRVNFVHNYFNAKGFGTRPDLPRSFCSCASKYKKLTLSCV